MEEFADHLPVTNKVCGFNSANYTLTLHKKFLVE